MNKIARRIHNPAKAILPLSAITLVALTFIAVLTTLAINPPATMAQAGTDATLSGITVNGNAVPGFAADRTSYEYGVASTVTSVTIAATTTDSDVSWTVTSPSDADGDTAGH